MDARGFEQDRPGLQGLLVAQAQFIAQRSLHALGHLLGCLVRERFVPGHLVSAESAGKQSGGERPGKV
jgi:hypothetical protein